MSTSKDSKNWNHNLVRLSIVFIVTFWMSFLPISAICEGLSVEKEIRALLKEAEELRECEETESALRRVEQAADLARKGGQVALLGEVLHQKAILLGKAGKPKEALTIMEEAIDSFHQAGDAYGEARSWKNKGVLLGFLQRPVKEVMDCFNRARGLSGSLDPAQKKRLEALLFQGEGSLNQALGDLEKAKGFFTKSRTLFHELEDYRMEIDIWTSQVELIKDAEEKWSVLAKIEQLAKESNYVKGEIEVLLQRGEILWRKGKTEEAFECHKKALGLSEGARLKRSQSGILATLGENYLSLGRLVEAEEYLTRAYTLCKEIGNPLSSYGVTGALGILHEKLGNLKQSMLFYRETAHHAGKIGWDFERDRMEGTVAALEARYSGKYDVALEEYKRLKDICARHSIDSSIGSLIPRFQCHNLLDIANCYLELGDYDSALAYTEEAKTLAIAINDSTFKLMAYQRLALILLCNLAYQEASDYFSQCIVISEELGNLHQKASSLEGRGCCYLPQGRWEEGLKDLEEALRLYIACDNLRGINDVYEVIARAYKEKGEHKKALENAQKAVETASRLGPFSEAFSLVVLGEVQLAVKDYTNARATYEKSAALLRNLGLYQYAWVSYCEMGHISLAKKEYETAYEDFKQSLALATKWRDSMKYLHAKGQLEGYSIGRAYEGMVQTLMTVGRYEEAFYYTGLAKARYFIELLNKSSARFPLGDNPTVVKLQRLEKERFSYLKALSVELLNDKKDVKRIEDLQGKLSEIEESYERLLEGLSKQYPQLVSLKIESSCMPSDIQKLLSKEDLLLEYFTADKALIIWVVTKEFVKPVILEIERRQLNNQVEELMNKLKSSNDNWSDSASNLSRNIMEPVKEFITKKKHLIIVPHMALHWLPFEVLLEDSKLYNKITVSYLPSSTLLPTLYGKKAEVKSFLGLANPYLEPNFAKTLNLAGLSKHEEGVNVVSKLFSLRKVYTLREANRENLEKEARHFDIIHISCHGVFDPKDPLLSFLILSQTEGAEKPQAWALTAAECFALNLRASLVTLCACVTGRGEIDFADNFLGLSRAFIYAGASSVVVSFWSVDSEATNKLMLYFYESIAKEGLGKAQALQKAKLKLQKDKGFEHPYYWAPFVLIGAPQ